MPNPTGAPDKKRAGHTEKTPLPTYGLLMDLETLIKNRRETLKKSILTHFSLSDNSTFRRLFYQVGLAGTPSQIARLFAKESGADAAPADAVSLDMKAFYASDKLRAVAGAFELISQSDPVVLITWLEAEAALRLLETLDLNGSNVHVFSAPSGKLLFPDSTVWTAATQMEGVSASRLVAVVDSEGACREALAAGVPCIGVPDEWTSFQDFGGANRVLDGLNEVRKAVDGLREG